MFLWSIQHIFILGEQMCVRVCISNQCHISEHVEIDNLGSSSQDEAPYLSLELLGS
jgi:hypothetical protein